MDAALTFLERRGGAMGLRHQETGHLVSTLLTPSFDASSHAVFLIREPDSPSPLLVVKVPRLQGDTTALVREAENLKTVQSARPGGFDSVPRLLALEEQAGVLYLVQTGLPGDPLSGAYTRAQRDVAAALLLGWVTELGRSTAHGPPARARRRWVDEPLEVLDRSLAGSPLGARLSAETRRLADRLTSAGLPAVFEHGDLSAPNLLVASGGRLGVVDWEMGDRDGMPGQDLFFTLAFLAVSSEGGDTLPRQLDAFRKAFFGTDAWARPFAAAYARAFEIPDELMPALFALCWCRYLAWSIDRTHGAGGHGVGGAAADIDLAWIARNRFFAFWREAVDRADELLPTKL